MKKILVVEDEEDINSLIREHLSGSGFEVESVYGGDDALEKAEEKDFDLIVLDILLPGLDGWEVCQQLRRSQRTRNIPIVFLSALSREPDRIRGFDLGGDDYIVKPFSPRELVSRVKAILKRVNGKIVDKKSVSIGDLKVDFLKHQVYVGGKPAYLTSSEFKILHVLISNEDRVFTRDELLDAIGEEGQILEYGNIDVHVHHLRQKIERDPKNPKYIKTVWGVGYRFASSK
ncbi:response regulator transcription factor [candidate division KSB1 bacterium]|nr:response regulator transcription factor [candidate division KSB1 bacterium]NIR70827.1 response regulator transcription factor [candidate division KSB1 bacterium]NIS27839.1 response regulator transcription factor [candidate division KSB1 bacterium]NIT74721.1 response regulator transcription factor [candidate division KSB1 bacterium]NIU28504.1 response regulator transcription factor [candidate division KSB1 bacterium]